MNMKSHIFSIKNLTSIILFENENFVAINKPSGLLSIPDRKQQHTSLKDLLEKKYTKIYIVHRLDRDTSGVIVFAKNAVAHQHLSQLFENRQVTKYYLGLVQGNPSPVSGTIELPIAAHPTKKGLMVIHSKGKTAITDYETINQSHKISLVKFQIHTGRTHQIRLHAKSLGHPIVCDSLYGNGTPIFLSNIKRNFKLSKSEETEKPLLARLGLHSYQVSFKGLQGDAISITADLPKDMKALYTQLKKNE